MAVEMVTCHTERCENSGIAIPFLDAAEMLVCGPCGNEITDRVATDASWTEAEAAFRAKMLGGDA